MKRVDIVKRTSERLGLDFVDTNDVVTVFLSELGKALSEGENVTLRGLGAFTVLKTKPRPVNDMRRGVPMMLPARKKVKFKPSIYINNKLKQNEETN